MIWPPLTSIIYQPIILSCLHYASMSRTLSSTVQCFVARSAYWITMNPLTRCKALKVTLRPLPLSRNREKVSPLYETQCEESSEFQEESRRLILVRWIANISECCIAEFTYDHRCNILHEYKYRVMWINIVLYCDLLLY